MAGTRPARTSSATLPGPATTWQPHCPQHWQQRHREQRDEDIDYDRKLLQGAKPPAHVGGARRVECFALMVTAAARARGRRNLGDIDRRDHRCHAHAHDTPRNEGPFREAQARAERSLRTAPRRSASPAPSLAVGQRPANQAPKAAPSKAQKTAKPVRPLLDARSLRIAATAPVMAACR